MASTSMRLRGVPAPSGRGLRQAAKEETVKESLKKGGSNLAAIPDIYVIAYLLLICLFTAVALRSYWALPLDVPSGDPNRFNSQDARKHLEDIVALGIRHVGSEANEVHAVNLIVRKVEEIRRIASKQVEIELSLQHPSGHFYLDFPANMIQLYHNITNIVVRFKKRGTDPQRALLINAHYDSALGSPAASDDAASCATMLEILHCLAADPRPFLPDHAVIFLFNGAEETVLQASHGFVTQHPWAAQIRAFLNLEAAGAGGKEIVFQTGPDHPWLARIYASVAPHPFASVIAQEVFQSGIIPSDTDFRIFRDYGHMPGIDMAFFVNGYIYHTEHDVATCIPDGSIQRAGENVLSLVKELAASPFLDDPGSDKHGKVIFFDVLGLFSVVYPERIAIIVNCLIVLFSMAGLYSGIAHKKHQSDKPSLGMVLKALAVSLLSWVAAIGFNLLTALILSAVGRSMSWFTHTSLLLPLYIAPALLAMGAVYSYWQKKNPVLKAHLFEQSSFHAITLFYTLLLALLTYLRVCSAFFFAVWLLFSLVFRHLLWDIIIQQALSPRHHRTTYYSLFTLCMAFSLSLPFIFSILLIVTLMDFFVPLTGRLGSYLPPDVAIGGLVAMLVCIIANLVVPFVVYMATKRLRKVMGIGLLLLYIGGLTTSLSGYAFPYAGGESPTPKRLFLQHGTREFLNRDGTVRHTDSRVAIVTMDYQELKPVAEAVPAFAEAQEWECDGVYCGIPYYLPLLKHIKRNWYLPAPKLENYPPLTLHLMSVKETLPGRRNFTFHMQIPKRASLFIGPRPGHTLSSWSLEDFVPDPLSYGQGELCHFIFYSRGTGEGKETLWIEIEGPDSAESVDIAVAAQHLDPPLSETQALSSLVASLPDWVTPVSWTSTYTSWVF